MSIVIIIITIIMIIIITITTTITIISQQGQAGIRLEDYTQASQVAEDGSGHSRTNDSSLTHMRCPIATSGY